MNKVYAFLRGISLGFWYSLGVAFGVFMTCVIIYIVHTKIEEASMHSLSKPFSPYELHATTDPNCILYQEPAK